MKGIPLKDLDPKWDGNFLLFDCPCELHGVEEKCGGRIRLPVLPEDNGWKLESGAFAEENLTLSPSIRIHATGNPVGSYCAGWHGFLRNGIMEPC